MKARDLARTIWVFVGMVGLGIANFIVFGLVHELGWKDAEQYSAYAKNLLLGHGYSLDGVTVDAFREPGISFYLLPFYKVFGIETQNALFASFFVQGVLIGILGFLFYRVIRFYGPEWLALIGGAVIASLPILGDHTHDVGTETLFTFLLGLIFFLCMLILRVPKNAQWYLYALLGLAGGYETLVRFQFAFFLPFIAACFLIVLWHSGKLTLLNIRNTIVSLVIFAALPLSFASYIYEHTGVFAVTEGRQDEMLYTRAVRTELGVRGQTRYLHDWFLRSFSGGYNSQFLADYDYQKLHDTYVEIATTSEAVAAIRQETIRTISENPGSYLFGNIVETIKLFYIEHDYSDTWSRYFRPLQYLIMYSFFLFGMYQFFRTKGNWDVKSMVVLALLFIFYNAFTLSFFYTVSRFNTPYLPLFILIGFLGVVLYLRKREPAKNLRLF